MIKNWPYVLIFFTLVAVSIAHHYRPGANLMAAESISAVVSPKGEYPGPWSESPKRSQKSVEKIYFDELSSQLDKLFRTYRMHGASVAVMYEGKLVYAKGFGMADVEEQVAVHDHHLFRIASVSKLITATGIMKLVDMGLISLEQKVFGYQGLLQGAPYDSYRDKKYEQIRVKHLLNHTAGWSTRTYGDPMFKNAWIAAQIKKPQPISQEDIIEFVLGYYLPYRPGTMTSYSNLGYVLLEKIIEQQSGIAYEDFIRTQVLQPMGIYRMQLGKNLEKDRLNGEVKYYDFDGAPLRESIYSSKELVSRVYGGTDVEALGGAGAWVATPTDLLRLMGGLDPNVCFEEILSPAAIEEMTTSTGKAREIYGWKGVKGDRWWRTGTLSGTHAVLVRKDEKISYAIITNTGMWKGPVFNNIMMNHMDRYLDQIEVWPSEDFFDKHYVSTVPKTLPPKLLPL